MTRFNLIVYCVVTALFLHGCSQILEPVLLISDKKGLGTEAAQEDFNINIKSLTFESARKANNDPYPRQLMLNGEGSKANVYDEADFVTSTIPPFSKNIDYSLGIGDALLFSGVNEFVTSTAQFPTEKLDTEYLLGVGDELTLLQLNDNSSGLDSNTKGSVIQPIGSTLETSGLIGSDGNILLLGLGSIKAKNLSLNDMQTEIRNILIRNGLTPNFQLEITGFNSKKAFVTFPGSGNNTGKNSIPITNLPITLKEIAINYGVRSAASNKAIITLIRDGQKFRMTARQMFEEKSQRILIKNNDHIEIDQAMSDYISHETIVDTNGDILLPNIGSFKAVNKTLSEIQKEITDVLNDRGFLPNFQLEIIGFKSKKFFLVTEKLGSKAVMLTNSELSLKEAVLSNAVSGISSDAFLLVNLIRDGSSYQVTFQEILNGVGEKILIEDGDTLELKNFKYKPGQVFALSGAGNALMVPISPSIRETLADILFTSKGALNNLLAKRSEIYLLRGQSPSVAYHLDAQNVSRILVAAKTELRPNDIVYVADRPIISFSRTLSEILPLRILLRDIQNNNIP